MNNSLQSETVASLKSNLLETRTIETFNTAISMLCENNKAGIALDLERFFVKEVLLYNNNVNIYTRSLDNFTKCINELNSNIIKTCNDWLNS